MHCRITRVDHGHKVTLGIYHKKISGCKAPGVRNIFKLTFRRGDILEQNLIVSTSIVLTSPGWGSDL